MLLMFLSLSRAKLVAPTLLTLIGLAVLGGLGTWQLERKAWKERLIAALASRSAAPPVPATATWPGLPCFDTLAPGSGNPCEFQAVAVRGTFDHTRERHIFTAAPDVAGLSGGRGYWVFTPLHLEGNGHTVFVNRGYVPEPLKDPTQRVIGQTTQAVEITGLYRSAQERSWFDAANDPARNVWFVRSPAELWPVDENEPVLDEHWAYVDATGPEPAGGWPKPLAGKIALTNRHFVYAITWYGLALTLLGVYAAFAWGRIRAKP